MIPAAPPPTPLANLGRFRFLAHHPDCARHDHHLVRPFGRPLCLGCAGMWSGIVLGAVAIIASWPIASGLQIFGVSLLCYGPTFGQPWVRRRWYKLPARFMLGLGFALGGASLVAAPLDVGGWILRLVAVGVTYGLYRAATELRSRRSEDPCVGCPWGSFPLCAHNLPHLRQLRDETDDPGQRAFLSSLVTDLEPLAAIPPNFDRFPEDSSRQVGFEHRS